MPECTAEKEAIFVGIDHSMTGTGVVVIDQDGCIHEQKLIKTTPDEIDEKRMTYIIDELSFIPKIVRLKRVYIEGPSFASTGQAVLQMGALHYLIRIFLYRKKVKYKIIAPGTLKKFITGSGAAKKEQMLLHIYKKWNVEFKDNNTADAYSLARLALEEYYNDKKSKSS
jgi:crossover junction endodeoxyribonuclease RuvC